MSAEHRDEIYLWIEAERREQERNGYETTTLWGELRAVLKVVFYLVTKVGAQ